MLMTFKQRGQTAGSKDVCYWEVLEWVGVLGWMEGEEDTAGGGEREGKLCGREEKVDRWEGGGGGEWERRGREVTGEGGEGKRGKNWLCERVAGEMGKREGRGYQKRKAGLESGRERLRCSR